MAAMMEEDAGCGVSMDPRETIWGGGAKEFDLDDKLSEVIRATAAINMGRALMRANPLPDRRPDSHRKRKTHETYRLERLLVPIMGAEIPRGAGALELEEQARRAAPAYYLAATDPTIEQTATEIFSAAKWPDGHGYDSHRVANELKPLIRYFNKHKDRLLLSHSAQGLDEFDYAMDCIDEAVDALVRGGVGGRA